MGAQSSNTGLRRGARNARADALPTYHLDVVGVDALDVVGSAGGWLFDRAMAGWDVQVTLTRDCDRRPLRILGVRIDPRESDDEPSPPVALAASALVLSEMPTLRSDMAAALRRGRAEVSVWGDARLAGLADGAQPVRPVQHRLSAAARAFKAQALAAAGSDGSAVDAVETFSTGNRSLLSVSRDLSPV